jgi:hypothetical protein
LPAPNRIGEQPFERLSGQEPGFPRGGRRRLRKLDLNLRDALSDGNCSDPALLLVRATR